MAEAIPQDTALRLQLAAIAGNEPDCSYLELRPLTRDCSFAPRARAFVPVRELDTAAALIGDQAHELNAYVGAAPRVRQDGTAASVERVWTLWSDLDDHEALVRLDDFRPLPSIVIRTGSGGAHAYWPLKAPVSPNWAQRANRRLTQALGADMAATDPARILRPAGTLNHKHKQPRPVACTRLELDVFTFDQVVGNLPDTGHYAPRPVRAPAASSPSAALNGAADYVRDAPRGTRNRALNWAAWRMAPRIAAGELDAALVRDELRQAALDAGLGEAEIHRTIASGLTAGRAAA